MSSPESSFSCSSVISLSMGLILRDPSPPKIYTGSMVTGKWFSEIFGCLYNIASLGTLISSNRRASRSSAFPATHSSLSTLPTTVEVYRVTPTSPLLCGNVLDRPEDQVPSTTYSNPRRGVGRRFTHRHQSTEKHGLVTQGTFRISVSSLATSDHRNWTSTLFCNNSTTVLTRICPDDSSLKIYCSDQSLIRSLKSPPSTHSTEVIDRLYELVHLLADVFTSYLHQSEVRTFSPNVCAQEHLSFGPVFFGHFFLGK